MQPEYRLNRCLGLGWIAYAARVPLKPVLGAGVDCIFSHAKYNAASTSPFYYL